MSGIVLDDVMDDLAAAVQTVLTAGRTASARPVEGVQNGDAVVGYPQDPIALTQTFRRGMDRCVVPVFLICGLPQDEATRTTVAGLLTGASSIVTAIEGYTSSAWSSVSVQTAQVDRYDPVGLPPMVAVRFNVDVIS